MLADSLIDAPGTMKSLLPVQRFCYRELGKRVKQAARYVLDRPAVDFIQTTSEMHPARFLSALAICRMPFPKMWIEFSFHDRLQWIKSTQIAPNSRPDATPPKRLGFYLEQQPDESIQVTPVWMHAQNSIETNVVSICSLSNTLNLTTQFALDPNKLAETREQVQEIVQNIDDRYGVHRKFCDPQGMTAWTEFEQRITVGIPEFMAPYWLWVQRYMPDKMKDLREAAEYDLLAEWRVVLALLLAMNSRNVIRVGDEVRFDKLNKNRMSRGKEPLLSHRVVKLGLSRAQYRRSGEIGTSDLHRHWVMGHWKVRKTGLFYWHDFQRGNVGEAIMPTVQVTV